VIRFALRRILAAIPIGLLVTLGVFALVFAMPGDPLRELAGDKPVPPSVLAAERAQFHLDRPLLVQYGLYLKDIVTGHFGETFDGRDIGEQLRLRRCWRTPSSSPRACCSAAMPGSGGTAPWTGC